MCSGSQLKIFAGPCLYKQLESSPVSRVSTILAVPNHQILKKKFWSGHWEQCIGQDSLLEPACPGAPGRPPTCKFQSYSSILLTEVWKIWIGLESSRRGETGTGPLLQCGCLWWSHQSVQCIESSENSISGLRLGGCQIAKAGLVNTKEGTPKA